MHQVTIPPSIFQLGKERKKKTRELHLCLVTFTTCT